MTVEIVDRPVPPLPPEPHLRPGSIDLRRRLLLWVGLPLLLCAAWALAGGGQQVSGSRVLLVAGGFAALATALFYLSARQQLAFTAANAAASALVYEGRLAEACAAFEANARRYRSPALHALSVFNLADTELQRGDLRRALSLAAAVATHRSLLRSPMVASSAPSLVATCYALLGELESAKAWMPEAHRAAAATAIEVSRVPEAIIACREGGSRTWRGRTRRAAAGHRGGAGGGGPAGAAADAGLRRRGRPARGRGGEGRGARRGPAGGAGGVRLPGDELAGAGRVPEAARHVEGRLEARRGRALLPAEQPALGSPARRRPGRRGSLLGHVREEAGRHRRAEPADAAPAGRSPIWACSGRAACRASGACATRRWAREVALKMLRPELVKEDELLALFVEEAKITAQLDHPNVPPVYAFSDEKRKATCFTMKVLEGQTLAQLLEQPRPKGVEGLLPLLEVLVRVCDAVAFAHSRGILHLDLKPGNVMVGEHGQIYVVDWGPRAPRRRPAQGPR
jgi:tetratricopeptide (TPR) repeat protein